jgi:hypothetical protein
MSLHQRPLLQQIPLPSKHPTMGKSTSFQTQSYEDAEQAIKYDDKNIKAYYLMG